MFVSLAVLPAPPSKPVITPFENKTTSIITWNLTNQTADSGPNYLVVVVEDIVVSSRLSPATTQLLIDTEPGATYIVTIVAYNDDGQMASPNTSITLDPEGNFFVRHDYHVCKIQGVSTSL